MTVLDASTQPFLFPEPLREGVIHARPNRFIMDVDFGDGAPVRCHCPAVSRKFCEKSNQWVYTVK